MEASLKRLKNNMANIQNRANYNKLKNVLKEVFQLDQADLDFGIYRIMNQKRDEINDFLEKRLLPQVTEILQSNGDGSNTKVQQELDKAIEQANSLVVDPETSPKVIELRSKLSSTTSVDSLEQEVYSHLANFFKRYYKEGDFISLRRYKKDVYAIPYEGEEVKLHWANHDQYYIKTSEYLKNYGFKLPRGKSVKFELKEASTEQNNNKEQSGKERRFLLFSELPLEVSEDGNALVINFTYEEYGNKVTQDNLNKEAYKALDVLIKSTPEEFHAVLEQRPTDKNKNRTLLEKHIVDFTAKNSFDYFIHKDLGGFLSRELDFYIKNEVLYLDDINTDNEQDFTSQLSKVKAIKQVAQKIITFLAQLENFQKKLWLKKKFVISTNYCISLDRIPEKYLMEIAKNEAQLEEWKELFKIDQIQGGLLTVKYTEPLSTEFLKNQPLLVLDTKFFSSDFKEALLSEIDDLDNQINGLLVNSENFQALNLLKTKTKLKHVYIDPPYNTGSDGFLYTDDYKNSSWLCFMRDRLELAKHFLNEDGSISISIDDNSLYHLIPLMNNVFGEENHISTVVVKMSRATGVKMAHEKKKPVRFKEYLVIYAKNKNLFELNPSYFKSDELDDRYTKFIENLDADCKNWKLSSLSSHIKNLNKEDRIKFFKSNHTRIIRLAATDQDLFKNTKGEKYFQKIETSTGLEKYAYDGQKVLFYTGKLKLINGELEFGENSGDIWHDVVDHVNDLSNEGGVTLQNGKKPEFLIKRIIEMLSNKHDLILDFFLGSGTSSSVSLKTNRKFIGIETNLYFDNVTKRRVLNTMNGESRGVSKEVKWKGGGFVKYHDLESYEDVLNNLSLQQNKGQESLLESSVFRDEYIMSYMLDVESRDSLLNVDAFKNPFNYKLNITRNNESEETVIDLVETFNYLIGLHVKTLQSIKGFKIITGVTNARDEETLVIWRNTEEKSNQDLNEFFTKMKFSTRDSEFQRIYVNGDNHLENLKTGDDKWKVVLIEEEFTKRMFDVQDV